MRSLPTPTNEQEDGIIGRQESEPDPEILAYSIFRFDQEEGEDVLYCYELQVSSNVKRSGIGKRLMDALCQIGQKTGMEKVMLTMQSANTEARKFYTAIGFVIDPSSPNFTGDDTDGEWVDEDDEEYDYEIMSKKL